MGQPPRLFERKKPIEAFQYEWEAPELQTDPIEETDADEFTGVGDAYRAGWMGQFGDHVQIAKTNRETRVEGFNPLDHIPEGYESYAREFLQAESPETIAIIQDNIDDMIAVRARRDARGWGSTLGSDLVAGVGDPINIIGGAAVRGVGAVRGALMASGSSGTAVAVTEIYRHDRDPTRDTVETAFGIVGGYALPGLIGGVTGALPARAVPGARPSTPAGPVREEAAIMPVSGRITSAPGPRRAPTAGASTNHPGLDIAAPKGTPVAAPLSGRVLGTGRDKSRGNWIEVDHGEGLTTRYYHLSAVDVKAGDPISRGAVIGKVGSTGRSTGNHLHYEARVNGRPIDPRRLGTRSTSMPPNTMVSTTPSDALAEGLSVPPRVSVSGEDLPVVMRARRETGEAVDAAVEGAVMIRREADDYALRDPGAMGARMIDPDEDAALASSGAPSISQLRGIEDLLKRGRLHTRSDRQFFQRLHLEDDAEAAVIAAATKRGFFRLPVAEQQELAKIIARNLEDAPHLRDDFFARTGVNDVSLESVTARLREMRDVRQGIEKEYWALKKGDGAKKSDWEEQTRLKIDDELTEHDIHPRHVERLRDEAAKAGKQAARATGREKIRLERRMEYFDMKADMVAERLGASDGTWSVGVDGIDEFVPVAGKEFANIHDVEPDLKLWDQKNSWTAKIDELRSEADGFAGDALPKRMDPAVRRRMLAERQLGSNEPWTELYARALYAEADHIEARLDRLESYIDGLSPFQRAAHHLNLFFGRFRTSPRGEAMWMEMSEAAGMLARDSADPQIRAMAARLLPLLKENDGSIGINVKHDAEAANYLNASARLIGVSEEGAEAMYLPATAINKHMVLSKGMDERVILHELVHAVFISRLGAKMATASPKLVKEFEKIRTTLAADYRKRARLYRAEQRMNMVVDGGRTSPFYGLTNIDEFIAELATNPSFRRYLQSGTMWDRVVDFLRQMVGLEKRWTPLLDDAFRALDDAFLEIGEQPGRRIMSEWGEVAFAVRSEKVDIEDEVSGWDKEVGDSTLEARVDPLEAVSKRVEIDGDLLKQGFKDKVWTEGFQGAPPLPADRFPTIRDWANFQLHAARERELNPRGGKETEAAYAKRIQDRALAELDAGKAPLTYAGGRIARSAVAFMPLAQAERLVPADSLLIDAMHGVAGDGATMMVGNLAGRAGISGGSVGQRRARWEGKWAQFQSDVRNLHRQAKQNGAKISFKQFDRMVAGLVDGVEEAKLSIKGQPIPKEAFEAVQKHKALMNDLQDQADRWGVFAGGGSRADQIAQIEARLQSLERAAKALSDPEAKAEAEALADAHRARLDEMKANLDPEATKQGPNYRHRIWNLKKLMQEKEAAIEMFMLSIQRRNPGIEPAKARAQAEQIRLMLIADPENDMAAGLYGAAKARTLDISNAEAWDFIVQDASTVAGVYTRRMGGMIEMARRFGDPLGLDMADKIEAELVAKGLPREKIDKALQLWFDQADRITGRFHGNNGLGMSNRIARTLKHITTLARGGYFLISQLPDIGRAIGMAGPDAAWKNLSQPLRANAQALGLNPSYAKQAGEALEFAHARLAQALIDQDDTRLVSQQSWFEAFFAKLQPAFYVINGMTPFTVMLKEWAATLAQHVIIEDSHRVAAALRRGVEPDPKMMARLASAGIERQHAMLIADMPIERAPNGAILSDLGKWAESGERGVQAAELLLGAINSETRRGVVTPQGLERARVMDGVISTRKRREAARIRVEKASARLEKARNRMRALREEEKQLGRALPPEVIDDAVDELRAAGADLQSARLERGVKGRIESPLLSLPFQFKTFILGAGARVTHSLLTPRDRSKLGAVFGMVGGAMIAQSIYEAIKGYEMPWPEFVWRSLERSGLGSWMGSTVDQVANLFGDDFQPDSASNEIGTVAGVGPGWLASVFDMAAGLSEGETPGMREVKKMLPYGNLIWLDLVLNATGIGQPSGKSHGVPVQPLPSAEDDDLPLSDVPDRSIGDMMTGMGVRDRRNLPPPPLKGPAEPELSGSISEITAWNARVRAKEAQPKPVKKGRRPRQVGIYG